MRINKFKKKFIRKVEDLEEFIVFGKYLWPIYAVIWGVEGILFSFFILFSFLLYSYNISYEYPLWIALSGGFSIAFILFVLDYSIARHRFRKIKAMIDKRSAKHDR